MKDISSVIGLGNRVHLIGIKGAGMSGLAQILQSKGFFVTGSDVGEIFFTDAILARCGIPIHEGFSAEHVRGAHWIIASNAYLGDGVHNAEINAARSGDIPVVQYSEALAHFFNESGYGIAIAGTHGKTTTSALLAHILDSVGLQPMALIGGEVLNWRSNARIGRGDFFVIEADEYRDAFLQYRPRVIGITNIDYDHPDYFSSPTAYRRSFKRFEENLHFSGRVFTARTNPASDAQWKSQLFGEHNQRNISLAAEIAKHLGVHQDDIRRSVSSFQGVRRRGEHIGTFSGNEVFDDYAHNPPKIEASLSALREQYPHKEIIVIFQPHTFSRTRVFLDEFASSLLSADSIYLLDVYASAREGGGSVSSDDIISKVRQKKKNSQNLHTIESAIQFFSDNRPQNAVIVCMGAGDINVVGHQLVSLP